MSKPRLTDRVLRGILAIEEVCGGMGEIYEAEDAPKYDEDGRRMQHRGFKMKQYKDAREAQHWARQMLRYREEQKEK